MRDRYRQEGLRDITRLLGLVDRNRYSPTYGCFDRNYWHYKITDFPSGAFQYSVLPLALVYTYAFPENPFYQKERIKELVLAGIRFTRHSSHKDGTCDDYYPYEKALGAIVFSLYACTEAYLILQERDMLLEGFFKQRADWLLQNDEPFPLANHQAVTGMALFNTYLITKESRYLKEARQRISGVLSLQSAEGWFQEYEGCDAGYLAMTIAYLAKYYQKTGAAEVFRGLEKAVSCASYFLHPDGSYGGEYGARNCSIFLAHGFEILGGKIPLATQLADKYLEGMARGKQVYENDDRSVFLLCADRLQAYLDYHPERHGPFHYDRDFTHYFKEARIYAAKKGSYYTVISLGKGGVLKVFRDDRHIYSDCGLIGRLEDGRVVVTQLSGDYTIQLNRQIRVGGAFHEVTDVVPTPWKTILFRLALLLGARSWRFGKVLKKLLTQRLILQKKPVSILFERTFELNGGLKMVDKIVIRDPQIRFHRLSIGSDHTSIYVAGSRFYQESVLHPWVDLGDYLPSLNARRSIEIVRTVK